MFPTLLRPCYQLFHSLLGIGEDKKSIMKKTIELTLNKKNFPRKFKYLNIVEFSFNLNVYKMIGKKEKQKKRKKRKKQKKIKKVVTKYSRAIRRPWTI